MGVEAPSQRSPSRTKHPAPDFRFMAAWDAANPPHPDFSPAPVAPGRTLTSPGDFGFVAHVRGVGSIILAHDTPRRIGVWLVDGTDAACPVRRLVHTKGDRPVTFQHFQRASAELGGLLDTGALPSVWAWNPPPAMPPTARWRPRKLRPPPAPQIFDLVGCADRWSIVEWGVGVCYVVRRGNTTITTFCRLVDAMEFGEKYAPDQKRQPAPRRKQRKRKRRHPERSVSPMAVKKSTRGATAELDMRETARRIGSLLPTATLDNGKDVADEFVEFIFARRRYEAATGDAGWVLVGNILCDACGPFGYRLALSIMALERYESDRRAGVKVGAYSTAIREALA